MLAEYYLTGYRIQKGILLRSIKNSPLEFLFDFSICRFFSGSRFFPIIKVWSELVMLLVKIIQTAKKEKFHSDEKPSSKSFYGFSSQIKNKNFVCFPSASHVNSNLIAKNCFKCVGFSIRLCFTIYSLLLTLLPFVCLFCTRYFLSLLGYIASHFTWFIFFRKIIQ